jgi:hypothetical protein
MRGPVMARNVRNVRDARDVDVRDVDVRDVEAACSTVSAALPTALSTLMMAIPIAIMAALMGALLTGCATTTVDVEFDEQQDFSGYRTWDWLSREIRVEDFPGEEPKLANLASRLVGRELRDRGLVRSRVRPDLLVSYALHMQRQLIAVNETGAEALLASHHASPSYLIQATQRRVDVYESGHLLVLITDGRSGRVVWRGDLRAHRRDDFGEHLPEAVSQLVALFPRTAPTGAPLQDPDPAEPGPRNHADDRTLLTRGGPEPASAGEVSPPPIPERPSLDLERGLKKGLENSLQAAFELPAT